MKSEFGALNASEAPVGLKVDQIIWFIDRCYEPANFSKIFLSECSCSASYTHWEMVL